MNGKNKKLFLVIILFVCLISVSMVNSSFVKTGQLKVTTEHPFLQDGEWIEAENLKNGDTIITKDGRKATITSVRKAKKNTTVYNLEDEKYHNYIVDGLVVHNSNSQLSGIRPDYSEYTKEQLLAEKPKINGISEEFSGATEDDMVELYHYTSRESAQNIMDEKYFLPSRGLGQEGTYFTTTPPDEVSVAWKILHLRKEQSIGGDLAAVKIKVPKSIVKRTWEPHAFDVYFVEGSNGIGFNYDGIGMGDPEIITDIPTRTVFKECLKGTAFSAKTIFHTYVGGTYRLCKGVACLLWPF